MDVRYRLDRDQAPLPQAGACLDRENQSSSGLGFTQPRPDATSTSTSAMIRKRGSVQPSACDFREVPFGSRVVTVSRRPRYRLPLSPSIVNQSPAEIAVAPIRARSAAESIAWRYDRLSGAQPGPR